MSCAIASWALAIRTTDPDGLASAVRRGTPAVLARIVEDQVLFDARTVLDGEDDALLAAIRACT